MSPAEAKRILAAYLVGRRVSREELAQASDTLRADQASVEFLNEELGSEGESVCDRFLSRLGEMGELPAGELERRMPELAGHARVCPSCRHAYWTVRPLWTVGALSRALAGHIGVAIDAAGRLFEAGFGPPALEPQWVAATAGEETEGMEWELPDAEAGCTIRLAIQPVSAEAVKLSCALQCAAEAPQVRIEVRASRTGALFLGGRSESFEAAPILLPRGSWTVRLRMTAGTVERTWEVPLALEERGA